MADEQMTRSAAITEWLAQLGYPAASLQTPMQPHIERWWGYLSREASFYTRRLLARRHGGHGHGSVDLQRTRGDQRSR